MYLPLPSQDLEQHLSSAHVRNFDAVSSATQKLRRYWHWILHVLALFLILLLLFFGSPAFSNTCDDECAHQGEGRSSSHTLSLITD
jgi:hypothetical protein